MLTVQRENVCSNYFSWFTQLFMVNASFSGLYLLKTKTCGTIFREFSISAFIFIQQTDLHANSLINFLIPLWLLDSQYSVWFCNSSAIIMQLSLIMITSLMPRSYLNVMYGLSICRFICLLASFIWCSSLVAADYHLVVLLAVYLVLTCILECPLLCASL